jgi:hypothetical protein
MPRGKSNGATSASSKLTVSSVVKSKSTCQGLLLLSALLLFASVPFFYTREGAAAAAWRFGLRGRGGMARFGAARGGAVKARGGAVAAGKRVKAFIDAGHFDAALVELKAFGSLEAPIPRALSGTVSGWLYVNMESRRDRGMQLERVMFAHGVPQSDIYRVPAVTPDMVAVRASCDGGPEEEDEEVAARICALPGGIPGKTRVAGPTETVVSISHLRAVKMAYDKGLQTAIILEDDVNITTLMPLWNRPGPAVGSTSLKTLMDELVLLKSWEIVQLGVTIYTDVELVQLVGSMLAELENGRIVAPRWQSLGRENAVGCWGAFSYMVSRMGMKKILDRHWPGGSSGPSFEHLPHGSTFDFHGLNFGVSDFILYATATAPENTLYTTRPLFLSGTATSDIHTEHLDGQARSQAVILGMLYHNYAVGSKFDYRSR